MTIYITGDIHGNPADIKFRLYQIKNPSPDDRIIICGDAGLEYGGNVYGSAKKEMKKFPGKWIIVRGNHDTRYWRDHSHDDLWSMTSDGKFMYQHKYPNILYTRDKGGIIDLDGYKFLCIPGAYSIDKYWRLSNRMPYEPEEQLTELELSQLSLFAENFYIDFVVAHTYPISIEPYVKYLFMDGIPQYEIDKTMEHAIENILSKSDTWKHYFFGHMHDNKEIDNKYTMLYDKVVRLDDYV